MAKGRSQVMDLFLSVAESLGFTENEAIGHLADASPEAVANWRNGSVREFKTQKFRAALDSVREQLMSLRDQAGLTHLDSRRSLTAIEVEDGASPADLQRQFRERVHYDYLGHRFLYFESPGALAWENLIRAGYEQNCWLAGVEACARAWLELTGDSTGTPKGAIAAALGLGRRDRARGLDVVSLGPGEGGKEAIVLSTILDLARERSRQPRWLSLALVDVSIPLLLTAARRAHGVIADSSSPLANVACSVRPFCADFEEGPLTFLRSMPTGTQPKDGRRLILLLGNVMGNVRDEELFVREKLSAAVRPGDLLWIEVGLRQDNMDDDPLFAATKATATETASQANRRLLLEGPYRRWAAASGRATPLLTSRIWLRENDDSSRVPGSCNFCHDLLLEDEGRVCTMLYSRRYDLTELTAWFEARDYEILGLRRVTGTKGAERVAHILMRRR